MTFVSCGSPFLENALAIFPEEVDTRQRDIILGVAALKVVSDGIVIGVDDEVTAGQDRRLRLNEGTRLEDEIIFILARPVVHDNEYGLALFEDKLQPALEDSAQLDVIVAVDLRRWIAAV